MIFGWIIPVVIVANIPARLLIKSLGQPAWLMFQLIVAATIAVLSPCFLAFCPASLFQRQLLSKVRLGVGEKPLFEIAPKPLAREMNCP